MRRDRGSVLIAVVLVMCAFALLLSVAINRYVLAQREVRRHDAGDAALHAARGAVRRALGTLERDASFVGSWRQPHELGPIVVTVDASSVRAEIGGRRVTAWRVEPLRWEEE